MIVLPVQHVFFMRKYESLRQLHPCLSDQAGRTGRLHLPVSPVCNLGCRYCARTLTVSEERPGTSVRILPVSETPEIVGKALSLCPEITTVGIAGPGEALASPHALEAFRLVDERFPDLIKCLSTNGLMLSERAEELAGVNVDTVTVTVNAVDPEIEARINSGILYHGQRIEGTGAAEILVENQIAGIKKVSGLGMTVKINTVLIPGINDLHVGRVAEETAKAGAKLMNIIPLIPQAALAGVPAPSCEEVEKARAAAGECLTIFRHCRHCRADAAGTLGGTDFGRKIYGDRIFEEENFSHG